MSGAEEMQISMDFDLYSWPEADIVDSYNRFLEHTKSPPPKMKTLK